MLSCIYIKYNTIVLFKIDAHSGLAKLVSGFVRSSSSFRVFGLHRSGSFFGGKAMTDARARGTQVLVIHISFIGADFTSKICSNK